MSRPRNPYVAGRPLGGSYAFVGRADLLREVLRELRRPQGNAILLFGQRRIGKTSVLLQLMSRLPEEGPYRPVYFDLQDKAAWSLERVLRDLARIIAHTLDQPDPDLGSDPETAFRYEWLPSILDGLPDDCSLVLLFDEFDVLATSTSEQAAAAFFPYLRTLLASDPARLQFVFVIGRNVDDLDTIALSHFKGRIPYRRVSLLDKEDTADLVRLSQANDSLLWPDDAVEQVWLLTHGHPFLTQGLCSRVWEWAYDQEPDVPPSVAPADVVAAVSQTLVASNPALEWLWDGLGPAERVVASALAKAGPDPITEYELNRLLHESGVHVVIRELQHASRLLQDWDILESTQGRYQFRVELFRHWVMDSKPLSHVREELEQDVIQEKIRLDVACPETVQVDQTFEIAVRISQPDSPPLIEEDLTKAESRSGTIYRGTDKEIVRYRVRVSAPDCEVYTDEHVFLLRSGQNSEVVFFQLTAEREGELSIVVTAYQDDDLLAAMTRIRLVATLRARSNSSAQPRETRPTSDVRTQLQVYETLNTGFSLEELQDLCFRLSVDWESLQGANKSAKVRELVQHFVRRKKLAALTNMIRTVRPELGL